MFHKTDDGIKVHLNLAVLAYWIVSVTKYRLKQKEYPTIRVGRNHTHSTSAGGDSRDGHGGWLQGGGQAEYGGMAVIYSLLDANPKPIEKVKSVVPLKPPPQ